MNLNLNFVILYVNDIQKATAFYRDTLEMSVIEQFSSPNFVTLSSKESGAVVALQSKEASKLPPKFETSAGGVELSFAVEDVDATYQRWQERGVEMVTPPLDLPFGRYFMAKDAVGFYLSVYRFGVHLTPQAEAPIAASN